MGHQRNHDALIDWDEHTELSEHEFPGTPASALSGRVDYVDLAERVAQGVVVNRVRERDRRKRDDF